ncbi:MAG: uroporphyrinogen decarboxylase [Chlamydiales bacterium]|jgi:uroporphyrinogen decarboxylase
MDPLFLSALHCQNDSGRPPVWLMRQAGRYMPQYQAFRKKHRLLELFRKPELAAEVTLLPVDLLGVDAAILFSDILVIVEALGLGLDFAEGMGPVIDSPIQNVRDIENLPTIDVREKLDYVAQTIKLVRPQLNIPLIGFSGAPFTIASYMIEGRSSRDLKKTRQLAYHDERAFHTLLQKLTDVIIDYLQMQVDAGAQTLQIFDSWANYLSPSQFHNFVYPYLKQIVEGLRGSNVPIILFCRGSSSFIEQLIELKPHAISLDWSCEMSKVRSITPENIALQGNLDPFLLYAPKEIIKRDLYAQLDEMRDNPGYICNLGHGISPDMSMENVKYLVDCVKEYNYCPTTV